ncbi:MAG TPA: agmatine deiminase family protein, partial [Parvularculaceae bacterium]|nr:agmatine deiminase family protein [Parvularculaceae bacterium]
AASHMNFYIANHSVVMPSYGALSGEEEAAEQALAILHDVAGRPHAHAIDASHLLTGGGSFHCISQQQP